jgi:hypothetical protein
LWLGSWVTAIWMLVIGCAAVVPTSPGLAVRVSRSSALVSASSHASGVPESATSRSLGRTSNGPSPASARLSMLVADAITTDAVSIPSMLMIWADTVIKETESLYRPG